MNEDREKSILELNYKKIDDSWVKKLKGYKDDDYPPRAWVWAFAHLSQSNKPVTGYLCAQYAHLHKERYKAFLIQNELPQTFYDKSLFKAAVDPVEKLLTSWNSL